jgi:urea transport system permease protein
VHRQRIAAEDKISTALPALWLYALGALFIIAVTVLPKGIAGEFEGESRFRPGKLGDMFARWREGKAAA